MFMGVFLTIPKLGWFMFFPHIHEYDEYDEYDEYHCTSLELIQIRIESPSHSFSMHDHKGLVWRLLSRCQSQNDSGLSSSIGHIGYYIKSSS